MEYFSLVYRAEDVSPVGTYAMQMGNIMTTSAGYGQHVIIIILAVLLFETPANSDTTPTAFARIVRAVSSHDGNFQQHTYLLCIRGIWVIHRHHGRDGIKVIEHVACMGDHRYIDKHKKLREQH